MQDGKKRHAETEASGQFFRSTMMGMDSCLRRRADSASRRSEASAVVFRQLKERGHSDIPPSVISDGWGGIWEAMLEIFGNLQIINQREKKWNFLDPQRMEAWSNFPKYLKKARFISSEAL